MNKESIKNLFIGFSLADALGVPVEFRSREQLTQNPVKTMQGFGTHHQKEGTWSDDSSLAFCLAESLTYGYDLKDMAMKFIQWRNAELWTPYGRVFDIGIQTSSAIEALTKIIHSKNCESLALLKYETGEYTNGNGSLMRILPLLFYIKGKKMSEQFDIIRDVSALTHGHIRAAIACLIYLKFAEFISEGYSIKEAYEKMQYRIHLFFKEQKISDREIKHFNRVVENNISTYPEDEISSGGYVVHTLEAGLWCLLTTNSYLEAVFKAINLGDDTDTTATVVGGIAGYFYGLDDVPKQWIETLARKDDIVKLSENYLEKFAAW